MNSSLRAWLFGISVLVFCRGRKSPYLTRQLQPEFWTVCLLFNYTWSRMNDVSRSFSYIHWSLGIYYWCVHQIWIIYAYIRKGTSGYLAYLNVRSKWKLWALSMILILNGNFSNRKLTAPTIWNSLLPLIYSTIQTFNYLSFSRSHRTNKLDCLVWRRLCAIREKGRI